MAGYPSIDQSISSGSQTSQLLFRAAREVLFMPLVIMNASISTINHLCPSKNFNKCRQKCQNVLALVQGSKWMKKKPSVLLNPFKWRMLLHFKHGTSTAPRQTPLTWIFTTSKSGIAKKRFERSTFSLFDFVFLISLKDSSCNVSVNGWKICEENAKVCEGRFIQGLNQVTLIIQHF